MTTTGVRSALGVFGGERVGGLRSQGGVVESGAAPPSAATMRWWMPRTPTVGSGR